MFPADIADMMHDLEVIQFDEQNGWRLNVHDEYPEAPRSPIYMDFGSALRSVRQFRRRVTACVMQLIGEHGELFYPIDFIADVPQKATPYVTLISERTGIPMISPRMTDKTHGEDKDISGIWTPGQRVILCDDLRTTNKSFLQAISVCRRNGLVVVACFGVVDRSAQEGAPIGDVPYFSALRLSELLNYYHTKGYVSESTLHRCLRYPRELRTYMERYDLLRG